MSQGHLNLEIFWDGTAVTDVAIRNARPQASRLLVGRTPADALAVVPLLFSLCRHGQTIAAQHALAAAEGREDVDSRPSLVALPAEAAQEHLWRLLLDWPALLGFEPAHNLFAAWHRRLAEVAVRGDWSGTGRAFAAFCERELLGTDAAQWLASEGQSRIDRTSVCGKILAELENETAAPHITPFLPDRLDARTYYRAMAADLDAGFARAPTWQREAAETGPYARWRQIRPVAWESSATAARVLARMADLAFLALEITGRLPSRRRCDAFSPSPETGFAVVETARGLLIHYVRLEQSRIADYLIVAPTEWNFHPAGAFRNGLVGLSAWDAGTLERQARRLALALDPCVPFKINVRLAGHA